MRARWTSHFPPTAMELALRRERVRSLLTLTARCSSTARSRAMGAASIRRVEQVVGNRCGDKWGHGGSSQVAKGGRCRSTSTVELQGFATVPQRWGRAVSIRAWEREVMASQCGCQWVQVGGSGVCGYRQGVAQCHGSSLWHLVIICILNFWFLIYLSKQTTPKWKCDIAMSFS